MKEPAGQNAEDWKGALRVAFFGGSFDPPHLGHLAVARAARAAFHLDAVLFAPVGAQPLKPEGAAASFGDRLAMTRLAIEGEPGFVVSLVDAPKTLGDGTLAPNFTMETLEGLRAMLGPDCTLYLLMGADSYFGMRRWHRAAEIPFLAPLIVAWRPGQPLDGLRAALPEGLALDGSSEQKGVESGVEVRKFFIVDASGARVPFYVLPELDVEISATEIRETILKGQAAKAGEAETGSGADQSSLPGAVAEYIRERGLYR